MGDISGRLYAVREGIPGVRDDRGWSRVAEWLLALVLNDTRRVVTFERSIYIIYHPAFPRGKGPEKGIWRDVRRVFTYVLANVNGWLQGDRWSDCVYERERGYIWDKLLHTLDDVSYKTHYFILFKSCNFFDYCKYMFLNFSGFVLAIIFCFLFFFLFMKKLYLKKLNFNIFIMYLFCYNFCKREIISLCLLVW